MMKVTLQLEDTTVTAEHIGDRWVGESVDTLLNVREHFEMTNEQLAAVSYLAIEGDCDSNMPLIKAMTFGRVFLFGCRPMP